MHKPFSTILLLLPSLSFATPAQPISSLNLVAPNPQRWTPLPVETIDPRFALQALYQSVPLDEDQCLVTAVQLMGILGALTFTQEETNKNYWDGSLPDVVIQTRSPMIDGTIEVRYLVWGLYLGIKGMIETNTFRQTQFILRWDREIVGLINIKKRLAPLNSAGGNSTGILQPVSNTTSQFNLTVNESLEPTTFNLSTPSESNIAMTIETVALLDVPLSKYAVIMTLLQAILYVASRTTGAPVPGLLDIVPPPPFDARIQVLPVATTGRQPVLTFGILSAALRDIPVFLLLRTRRWSAVTFKIRFNGILVATGGLWSGRGGAVSSS